MSPGARVVGCSWEEWSCFCTALQCTTVPSRYGAPPPQIHRSCYHHSPSGYHHALAPSSRYLLARPSPASSHTSFLLSQLPGLASADLVATSDPMCSAALSRSPLITLNRASPLLDTTAKSPYAARVSLPRALTLRGSATWRLQPVRTRPPLSPFTGASGGAWQRPREALLVVSVGSTTLPHPIDGLAPSALSSGCSNVLPHLWGKKAAMLSRINSLHLLSL